MADAVGAAAKVEGPRRTCIACRATASARDLRRIAWPATSEGPMVGPAGGASPGGRGAWLHPAPDCVAGLRVERLSQALRRTVSADRFADLVDGLSRTLEGQAADT